LTTFPYFMLNTLVITHPWYYQKTFSIHAEIPPHFKKICLELGLGSSSSSDGKSFGKKKKLL